MAARTFFLWTPRLLGVALALGTGAFALDAGAEGPVALLMHLIPALVVLAAVALGWRWPWLGGHAFVTLAVAYGALAFDRLDWVAVVAGPLVVVGLLFLWSGRRLAAAGSEAR